MPHIFRNVCTMITYKCHFTDRNDWKKYISWRKQTTRILQNKVFFQFSCFFFSPKFLSTMYVLIHIPTSYNIIGSPINMYYFIFTHYFLLFCRRQDAMQLLKVSNLDIYINSRSQPSTKKDNLSQSWLVILS